MNDLSQALPQVELATDSGVRRLLPDPSHLWTVFRRHLVLFLGVAGVVILAVLIRTLTVTPVYESIASVVIKPRKMDVIDMQSVAPDLPAESDVVDTEVRMISSHTLALRVVDDLRRKGFKVPIADERGEQKAAEDVLRQVKVMRSGLTLMIDIAASDPDPKRAAAIANSFAEQYVASQRDAKVGATRSASAWLNQRLAELRVSAGRADAAVQRYKIANGLMSAQGATMAEQEVSALNQQISLARAELAEKQGRLSAARAQLQRGGGGADVGAALGSGTIGGLRAREAEASQQLAQLESRYGPLYPDVRTSKSQLADIRQQIQQEIDRILSNLDAEVRVAQSRLSSLLASQSRANGSLASNSSAQVGFLELQRRADATRQVYEAFLNRSKETSAQEGLQQADATISAFGQVPSLPASPNYKLAALFGLIGAILAGLVAVGLAEYLQKGLRTKSDVERGLRVRYAGAVPSMVSTLGGLRETEVPHDYIVSHPFSSFAEAFRSLRAFVMLRGGNARVLAIASALPQEGKSTTSICLGRTSALAGTSTVLVDCDLRRRGTSALLLSPEKKAGLVELLKGEATIDEALSYDDATGLYILGTTEAPLTAFDPLTPDNLSRLLQRLRDRFDLTILDTAPLLGVADARSAAAAADCTLLVARWRKTSRGAAEAAIDLLSDANANLAGLALTQVDIRQYASTGEGDSYGYHKKFSGYYQN